MYTTEIVFVYVDLWPNLSNYDPELKKFHNQTDDQSQSDFADDIGYCNSTNSFRNNYSFLNLK